MAQHNLGTVISFEIKRTLTKKQFWISTLIVPVAIAAVIGLMVLSNTTTASELDSQKSAEFSFTYSDASGHVDPAVAKAMGGSKAADTSRALAEVKSGKLDAYFAYPADPTKQKTQVYGADTGIFANGKYPAIATQLMIASAQSKIGDKTLAILAEGSFPVTATTYRNGEVSGGITEVIPPMAFVVVFYLVLVMLGNQMLTSLLEEKENRVTEMILTTMNPTTLVVGKVISLFIIGLVQIALFVLPVAVGYVFFGDQLSFPTIDLSNLVFNSGSMVFGALILLGGLALFTGTLVAVGAMMPTTKDAGGIFGVLMMALFFPFYAVSLVVSNPDSFIVQIFTFFPYTAPVTAMLRNAFGSLSPLASAIVIAELFVLSALVLRLAVGLFQYGSIEYTKRVSIATAFGRGK